MKVKECEAKEEVNYRKGRPFKHSVETDEIQENQDY